MPVPARAPERDLVLGQVLVLEQGLQVQAQAAPAWGLDQGQARVKGVLDPVALKDRTVSGLATEPVMAVLVRQTVQALDLGTAPVKAGLDRAVVGTNVNPSGLLKDSPHPTPLPVSGRWQGEGASLIERHLNPSSMNA
jgi:hypothetical protein